MTITKQSAKQKGRKLVQTVKEMLLSTFSILQNDDILCASGSTPGEDIQLSPLARGLFPFSVACKNQQNLSIWAALKQCQTNAGKHIPLLIFKRNHSTIYAAMPFNELLSILALLKDTTNANNISR